MNVCPLAISDVLLITPQRHADQRGYFSETYNARRFESAGINTRFVQDNDSYSAKQCTLRGLHYQSPPYAQAKLVRVLSGAILDVAIDARKASPTFGKWVKAELSEENGVQIFVPAGFLHGFITLAPDTHVAYKVDNYYDSASDGSVKWDDPDLAVDWGVMADNAILSDKDKTAQAWKTFNSPF